MDGLMILLKCSLLHKQCIKILVKGEVFEVNKLCTIYKI